MKKFQFRLESVLDARKKALEDAQLEMSKVQEKLRLQQLKLDELYRSLEHTKKLHETLLENPQGIAFTEVINCQNYTEKLKNDIFNQHKLISDTEMELDYAKSAVLEALKAKTTLEKLKEKQYKEFIEAIDKAEMAEIDDLATTRYKGSPL